MTVAHSGLKPRGGITRSPKKGISSPSKKDICPPPIFFLKKEKDFSADTFICEDSEKPTRKNITYVVKVRDLDFLRAC